MDFILDPALHQPDGKRLKIQCVSTFFEAMFHRGRRVVLNDGIVLVTIRGSKPEPVVPVQRAAELCDWLRELVNKGENV